MCGFPDRVMSLRSVFFEIFELQGHRGRLQAGEMHQDNLGSLKRFQERWISTISAKQQCKKWMQIKTSIKLKSCTRCLTK